jgi:hypothetical protein
MILTATEVKTKINVNDLMATLKALSNNYVLVGVPAEENRRPVPDKVGNAQLARIHDKGSPKMNIPARPFMMPGIAKAQNKINKFMMGAAKAKLDNDQETMMVNLYEAGLSAQNGVRNIIRTSEGFEPLKRGTLLTRTRKTASRKKMWKGRWDKREEIMASLKPLIDTGELLKSISFVVVGDEGSRKVAKER